MDVGRRGLRRQADGARREFPQHRGPVRRLEAWIQGGEFHRDARGGARRRRGLRFRQRGQRMLVGVEVTRRGGMGAGAFAQHVERAQGALGIGQRRLDVRAEDELMA